MSANQVDACFSLTKFWRFIIKFSYSRNIYKASSLIIHSLNGMDSTLHFWLKLIKPQSHLLYFWYISHIIDSYQMGMKYNRNIIPSLCLCVKNRTQFYISTEMERTETHYNQMENTKWAELRQKSPQTYQNYPTIQMSIIFL